MMIELVLICSFVTICLFFYNEFCAYYFMKKPEVYTKTRSFLYEDLTQHCQTLTKPYVPTFWASNRHLQTWLKTLVSFQEIPQISTVREYLQMEDNGIVSIDWVSKADSETINIRPTTPNKRRMKKKSVTTKSKPILLIIPNTLNTRVEDYSHLCISAYNKGFKPVFFNRRGYSGTLLTTPKITTYCDRLDLQETLLYVKNQFPFSDIYAIAFSMESGNLISYLGHEKEASKIAGAVCISSTFGCENHLDNNHALKQPYNYIITEKIKTILQNDVVFGETFGKVNVNDCHTMVELQNEIHARSNHYETLNEYLKYNSPLTHLNRIKVPVLFIQAKDDPVISQHSIPYEFFAMSEECILITTEHGGHCGFFQNIAPSSWADQTALDLSLIHI